MRFSIILQGITFSLSAHAVDPAAVYSAGHNETHNVALRIGNGDAGRSGLIEVLANGFIQAKVKNGSQPFAYIAYPIQALTAAITLNEYTITDRGTFLSISRELQNQTTIYKAATDDPSDPLLNPAHILIGKGAKNEKMADEFTQWAISADGQQVITSFKKNGQQLYTGAPANKTAQF
ncbi:Uncharacterized protein PECH_004666 [Penicillium ucsense]|uniref:PBP domain-containing protein n=1 Tax=Penicillium ucsense TaxID=2839758 RepID=A0A8J8WIX3_9EURO|nr:Uncharacterized protein PECM_003423 [Penicillium ucsense]KAF7736861.1 Uncharacterized protein PECH_004666 [Penicillium ucsense]